MIKLLLYQVIWPAILDLERVGTGVMLNGDDNENGFKTVNSSNQQKKKTNCTCSKLFLISKNKFARAARSCRCFVRLERCFVRLKRQTS